MEFRDQGYIRSGVLYKVHVGTRKEGANVLDSCVDTKCMLNVAYYTNNAQITIIKKSHWAANVEDEEQHVQHTNHNTILTLANGLRCCGGASLCLIAYVETWPFVLGEPKHHF